MCGQNLLLTGAEGNGKRTYWPRIWRQRCSRPVWDISFTLTWMSGLIEQITFENGAVVFRPGRCTACGISGGFAAYWMKSNMARNEALAVLHGILDFRRTIDAGYDVVRMDREPSPP